MEVTGDLSLVAVFYSEDFYRSFEVSVTNNVSSVLRRETNQKLKILCLQWGFQSLLLTDYWGISKQ